MTDASITKSVELLGVSRKAVLKVMTVFERESKSFSIKYRSVRKFKLSEKTAGSVKKEF